jgi:DNA polymerase kappa
LATGISGESPSSTLTSSAYLGIADNKVAPGKREERKSVGVERTFRDKTQDEDILNELESIAEELENDMTTLQYAGKTVTVKYKLHTYENKTRAMTVTKWIKSKDEIWPVAEALLKKELPLRIRLLGIRMSTLVDLTLPDKGIRHVSTAWAGLSSFCNQRRSTLPRMGPSVQCAARCCRRARRTEH